MDRLIALEGGRNFRDLGGYGTQDGRRVRWRRVFRSGSTAKLTAADCEALDGLGIVAVCDLRTPEECRHEPHYWQGRSGVDYWFNDQASSGGELGQLFLNGLGSGGDMRRGMIALYRELPFQHAPSYRRIFRGLAAGRTPFLFNCSAGKDRTGVAAAVLLSALGVPQASVVEDYAVSEQHIRASFAKAALDPQSPHAAMMSLPAAVLDPLLASSPDYLTAAFEAIEQRSGDVESYVRDVLGIGDQELAAIRDLLLE